ncbi:hypothetical protein ACHAXT_006030 [Thalassiosira profunda]
MTLAFHHCKLPAKGPFTWFCAVLIDLYEVPFPGVVLPSTPWIGGYTASPLLYWMCAYGPWAGAVAGKIGSSEGMWRYLRPLGVLPLSSDDERWVATVQLGICIMYLFHFGRRLLECTFVNTYTSRAVRRLSDVELSYYVLWGCLCGISHSSAALSHFGVVSPATFAVGAIVWAAGQVGNAYCHYQLQLFKERSNGGPRTIPGMFPFDMFLMPHYTAEMVGWTGYCICAGMTAGSLTIWLLSLGVLQIFTHERRLQYIKMHKDGLNVGGGDPSVRWGVFPGLECI